MDPSPPGTPGPRVTHRKGRREEGREEVAGSPAEVVLLDVQVVSGPGPLRPTPVVTVHSHTGETGRTGEVE